MKPTRHSPAKQPLALPVLTHLSSAAPLLICSETQQTHHNRNAQGQSSYSKDHWATWLRRRQEDLESESLTGLLTDNLVKLQSSDLVSSLRRFHHRGPECLCLHSKYAQSHPTRLCQPPLAPSVRTSGEKRLYVLCPLLLHLSLPTAIRLPPASPWDLHLLRAQLMTCSAPVLPVS